jgi:asparagine synthase (glutamine-hydrolysing)
LMLWDATRQTLWLARDAYGIKPLYYANDGWVLRVASQASALVACREVSGAIEPAALAGFLLRGSVPEYTCWYEDVRSVPAGCSMSIDERGVGEPRAFADLCSDRNQPDPERDAIARAPDMANDAAALFRDSVRAHLVADVEAGLMLSAGIDSASVLGLLSDLGFHGVKASTLRFAEFAETSADEVPGARDVAQACRADFQAHHVSRDEFLTDWPALLHAMDQPSIDGTNVWFAAKALRARGLKLALSGIGGDELLGGYDTFVRVPRWRSIGRRARLVPGLASLTEHSARAVLALGVALPPKAPGLLSHTGTWSSSYEFSRGLFMEWELPAILGAERARHALQRLHERMPNQEPDLLALRDDFERVRVLESSRYLRTQLLRDADWASMAHGLELRTPLVDWTLMQQVRALEWHIGRRLRKADLARSPQSPLPQSILQRPKTGFQMPFRTWLSGKEDGPRSAQVSALLRTDTSGARALALRIATAKGAL